MKIEVRDIADMRQLRIPASINGTKIILLPVNSTIDTDFMDWVQVPELRYPVIIDLEEWIRR